MLKGNDMIVSLDGEKLAASKGCSVDRKTDTIEVCSPVDGAAKRFIPGTTSWSVNSSGLYANAKGAERLRKIWRNYQQGVRTPLRVSFKTSEGVVEEGDAILTSLQESGNMNALATFSIVLQGSGPLENSGMPLSFDVAKTFVYLQIADGHLTIGEDEDDSIDYAEISMSSPWRLRIVDSVESWAILPGTASDWQSHLEHMDEHGEMDAAKLACGVEVGLTEVFPAGQYVVYASNYMSSIDIRVVAE